MQMARGRWRSVRLWLCVLTIRMAHRKKWVGLSHVVRRGGCDWYGPRKHGHFLI